MAHHHCLAGLAMASERLGRYSLLEEIASGGQGTIWRAYDTETNRIVALKVLHPHISRDASYVQRFHREASIIARIDHPNVVRVYEVGEADGRHFIAMEYLPESLARIIEGSGRLSIEGAVHFAAQIADGLEAAHSSGVVHRDVKPQNVLITADGVAKVSDFGVARAQALSTMTATGAMMGTPYYMSPEQANGERAIPQSDIYSLGCALYQMLAGEVPFNAPTPMAILRQHIESSPRPLNQLRDEVPGALARVVGRAMEKDPSRRFQTAAELANSIREAFPSSRSVSGAPASERDQAPEATPESAARLPAGWFYDEEGRRVFSEALARRGEHEGAETTGSLGSAGRRGGRSRTTLVAYIVVVIAGIAAAVGWAVGVNEGTSGLSPQEQRVVHTAVFEQLLERDRPRIISETQRVPIERTVVVEKLIPGERVIHTVVVEKPIPGDRVVETVLVERQVPIVQTVVVEKEVVHTVVVEKEVPGETVVETVIVDREVVVTPTPMASRLVAAATAASAPTPTPAPSPTPTSTPLPTATPTPRPSPTPTPTPGPKQGTPSQFSYLGTVALAHEADDDAVATWTPPYNPASAPYTANVKVEAAFINPYSSETGSWDYGFTFFDDLSGTFDVVIVTSEGKWFQYVRTPGATQPYELVASGVADSLETGAREDNKLRLVLTGRTGWLGVNGEAVGPLKLSGKGRRGWVRVVTGFFPDHQREGATTNFDDFSITPLRLAIEGESGELANEEGKIATYATNIWAVNSVAEATFFNPRDWSWSYGFQIRRPGGNRFDAVIVGANGAGQSFWSHYTRSGTVESSVELDSGWYHSSINTSAGDSNRVRVVAFGDEGWFFVNDQFMSSLKLPTSIHGEVRPVSGYFQRDAKTSTLFNGLKIWVPLDEQS